MQRRLDVKLAHRKERQYKDNYSDVDSALSSSQPNSLSPLPQADPWPCSQCATANQRASASEAECSRLSDALRDAREQLELLEFRVLELEDTGNDKCNRENFTDSDSGCVSPGSRIKDSASPELRRVDSGYKSPPHISPCLSRRNNESRTTSLTESGDSNELREHLEHMLVNCDLPEDRSCLEHVLMLLWTSQAVNNDEDGQTKLRRGETKSTKAVATISPYNQQHKPIEFTNSSDSLFSDTPRKGFFGALQESGIFEEVDTDTKETQTDFVDTNEVKSDLSKEIQRLDIIRERLEKEGVQRSKVAANEGLDCDCVKLGKKHRQFYERRLKFLEGKISIYEAAPNVKEAKLAQRLQNEFLLESRIQELESQLSTLQDKYDRLEQEFCELEELENDTRLQAQQLEVECEVAKAELGDMEAARECSRSLAERVTKEMEAREMALRKRENELVNRLSQLEKALPAIILWNVARAVGFATHSDKLSLKARIEPICSDPNNAISVLKHKTFEADAAMSSAVVAWESIRNSNSFETNRMLQELTSLELEATKQKEELEQKVAELERAKNMEIAMAEAKIEECKAKIEELNNHLEEKKKKEEESSELADPGAVRAQLSAMAANELSLKLRILELERREKAYMDMLTQADDMWAEMEHGYKGRISEIEHEKEVLKDSIDYEETNDLLKHQEELTVEDDIERNLPFVLPSQDENSLLRETEAEKKEIKQKLLNTLESQTELRVQLEKSERDNKAKDEEIDALTSKSQHVEMILVASRHAYNQLDDKYKADVENARQKATTLSQDLKSQKEHNSEVEKKLQGEMEKLRKELNRSCKSALDLEVTNSELREEVEALENQLAITQRSLNQCKKRSEEKIKKMALELSQKIEELEELRSEMLSIRKKSREADEGRVYGEFVAPKISDRMYHSFSYLPTEITLNRCSCPSLRNRLVASLIEDLFERMKSVDDEDLGKLCLEIPYEGSLDEDHMAKIKNYLLMAISKELVRSIGDADTKIDSQEWQLSTAKSFESVEGHDGVWRGARRLARGAACHAATRLAEARPHLKYKLDSMQEEVLDHSDVKIMEDQFANAIENIVNESSIGTNNEFYSQIYEENGEIFRSKTAKRTGFNDHYKKFRRFCERQNFFENNPMLRDIRNIHRGNTNKQADSQQTSHRKSSLFGAVAKRDYFVGVSVDDDEPGNYHEAPACAKVTCDCQDCDPILCPQDPNTPCNSTGIAPIDKETPNIFDIDIVSEKQVELENLKFFKREPCDRAKKPVEAKPQKLDTEAVMQRIKGAFDHCMCKICDCVKGEGPCRADCGCKGNPDSKQSCGSVTHRSQTCKNGVLSEYNQLIEDCRKCNCILCKTFMKVINNIDMQLLKKKYQCDCEVCKTLKKVASKRCLCKLRNKPCNNCKQAEMKTVLAKAYQAAVNNMADSLLSDDSTHSRPKSANLKCQHLSGNELCECSVCKVKTLKDHRAKLESSQGSDKYRACEHGQTKDTHKRSRKCTCKKCIESKCKALPQTSKKASSSRHTCEENCMNTNYVITNPIYSVSNPGVYSQRFAKTNTKGYTEKHKCRDCYSKKHNCLDSTESKVKTKRNRDDVSNIDQSKLRNHKAKYNRKSLNSHNPELLTVGSTRTYTLSDSRSSEMSENVIPNVLRREKINKDKLKRHQHTFNSGRQVFEDHTQENDSIDEVTKKSFNALDNYAVKRANNEVFDDIRRKHKRKEWTEQSQKTNLNNSIDIAKSGPYRRFERKEGLSRDINPKFGHEKHRKFNNNDIYLYKNKKLTKSREIQLPIDTINHLKINESKHIQKEKDISYCDSKVTDDGDESEKVQLLHIAQKHDSKNENQKDSKTVIIDINVILGSNQNDCVQETESATVKENLEKSDSNQSYKTTYESDIYDIAQNEMKNNVGFKSEKKSSVSMLDNIESKYEDFENFEDDTSLNLMLLFKEDFDIPKDEIEENVQQSQSVVASLLVPSVDSDIEVNSQKDFPYLKEDILSKDESGMDLINEIFQEINLSKLVDIKACEDINNCNKNSNNSSNTSIIKSPRDKFNKIETDNTSIGSISNQIECEENEVKEKSMNHEYILDSNDKKEESRDDSNISSQILHQKVTEYQNDNFSDMFAEKIAEVNNHKTKNKTDKGSDDENTPLLTSARPAEDSVEEFFGSANIAKLKENKVMLHRVIQTLQKYISDESENQSVSKIQSDLNPNLETSDFSTDKDSKTESLNKEELLVEYNLESDLRPDSCCVIPTEISTNNFSDNFVDIGECSHNVVEISTKADNVVSDLIHRAEHKVENMHLVDMSMPSQNYFNIDAQDSIFSKGNNSVININRLNENVDDIFDDIFE